MGLIDLSNPNAFRYNVEKLEDSILNHSLDDHSLAYSYPYVYTVGGSSKGEKNCKCYKLDLIKLEMNEICGLQLS